MKNVRSGWVHCRLLASIGCKLARAVVVATAELVQRPIPCRAEGAALPLIQTRAQGERQRTMCPPDLRVIRRAAAGAALFQLQTISGSLRTGSFPTINEPVRFG